MLKLRWGTFDALPISPISISIFPYFQIPRINISCNSGARIGLARDVLDILKVKLKPNGHDFDYLFIDSSEKERIGDQIVYEQHDEELKLIAVKGKKNEFIGVENLMGSGAIGGETSRAYREIPTYCYVTGRSVGIGAYTARLARRIIQHKRSQLILTGATALNTLLGKKVRRLGGREKVRPSISTTRFRQPRSTETEGNCVRD